jgi:F-type H+-transporting ATPase subunit delta
LIGSRVSKRYAKALLNLGQEEGKLQEYGRDLSGFSRFCQENGDFGQVIANRVFPVEDRKKILNAILERSGYSGAVKNFLNLLLDKDRIGVIERIASDYEKLTDEMMNVARAEVITVRPLKGEAQARLEKALTDLTSKKVEMEVRQDESLIGGIIVKIGDLVLDGSIKAQMDGLKESLKRGDYK